MEFFCPFEPTFTLCTQLWDSLTYCLFGQKHEDLLSSKRAQLLWWSSGMMLTQSVRHQCSISHWGIEFSCSLGHTITVQKLHIWYYICIIYVQRQIETTMSSCLCSSVAEKNWWLLANWHLTMQNSIRYLYL